MSVFSYEALVRAVNRLHTGAPFLRVDVIGRSLCGRGLFALRLGCGAPSVLLLAGLDGSRPQGSAALLQWVEVVCAAAENGVPLCGVDLSRALAHTGITVLPCLNPDGLEIARCGAKGAGSLRSFSETLFRTDTPWSANAAGVQLDRQFPFAFDAVLQRQAFSEVTSCSPGGFFGKTALSEPEPRALARFCRREHFARALLLDCGAGTLEVFPAKGEAATRETVVAAKLLAACAGVPFVLPTAGESCGRFSPWFALTEGKSAFVLSPESGDEGFYRRVEEALVLFALL